jgi:hypothetical protein
MDWVTLKKEQVERDALPPVCMKCGAPATCRVNATFRHTPEWVGWLYFAVIIPGLVAEQFFSREMRVSCPFCHKHRNHWSVLNWTAGLGWLVGGLLFAGAGFGIGCLFTSSLKDAPYIGLAIGAAVGILAWIGVLIYLATTRIDSKSITSDSITLHRVADGFSRAVRERHGLARSS